ncbi:hypothetical protein [Pseudarthrobacter sp. 1C304]|uniref:hypothetical protein n=1 Tax=Pseudarthrobacter sp. 1C304 TaxID=3457438 RepID=UPI003FD2878E
MNSDLAGAGFLAPLQYSAWFPWAGLGLLALVAAWYTCVLLGTRPRPAARIAAQTPAAPAAGSAPDLARLRDEYLLQIDAVDREAAAGTRSVRSAHQELSLLIRSFIRDASGVDAPRMTLAELRVAGQGPHRQPGAEHVPSERQFRAAADAVAGLYQGAFAAAPASAVPDAARAAREVVRSWN